VPLQNRVDPFGEIGAVPSRGLFTGNRGVIHEPETKTLLRRRWTTKAWIICALEHPGAKTRVPMGRNAPSGRAGWTELFFLDEVTALAAGHRPCYYCRRVAANAFRNAFATGNRLEPSPAPIIDVALHGQRLAAGATPPVIDGRSVRMLPDGAMIAYGDRAFAMRGGRPLAWSFNGYAPAPASCRNLPVGARLLTPIATVEALRAGYRPVWHASASR
jgi:hypothetical protein